MKKKHNYKNGNGIRKIAKEWQKSETTKYFGIILERIEDKFDLVAEGYAIHDTKISALQIIMNKEFDAVHKRFNEIDSILKDHSKILTEHSRMLAILQKDIAALQKDVAILQKDTTILKRDVAILQKDVEIIKNDISFLKGETKKKIDVNDYMNLERRVAFLESKIK